jgi:HEAT repeat protein
MASAETDAARVARLFMLASDGNVRHRDLVEPAKDSLGQMGEKAAPHLTRRLSTSDARERLTLADIFEKMGKVATPFLVPYLDSIGEDMPRNAARCLERIKDTAAVIPLLAHMDHPEYSVRSQVATALGKTGDRRALNELIKALNADPDSDVRKSCAVALGGIGEPGSLEGMRALFAFFGPNPAQPAVVLLRALGDEFFGVRGAALIALGELRPYPPGPVMAHAQVGVLVTDSTFTLSHNVSGAARVARHAAIVALGQVDHKSARKLLLDLLTDEDHLVRGFAIEGLSRSTIDKAAVKNVERVKLRETDPFVLAQIARFEQIVLEKKNEQSKPR